MLQFTRFLMLLPLLATCCTKNTKPTPAPATLQIFVGTYTEKLGHVDGKATGIYTCQLDTITGTLTVTDSVTDIANPSYVTLSPDKKVLYAVGENGGKPTLPYGSVAAYSISEKGKLTKINEVPSYGIAPCHVSTDRAGKFVFVANYATGNVLSYGIKPDGGLSDSLCMHKHAGKEPFAHQVYPSPDNRLLYAVDKGADGVFTYKIEDAGLLTLLHKTPAAKGSGPRHLDFNPKNDNQLAVIRENNSTLAVYQLDKATGNLICTDSSSTLPVGFTENNSCADVHYHPNGRFVYGSNRGHNSIAIFEISAEGRLKSIGHVASGGTIPRSFMITPDGKWMLVANQNSSTVQVYRLDEKTGMPTPVGKPAYVATPVCLKLR